MRIPAPLRTVLNFRVTLFFYLAYLLVNYVYVVLAPGLVLNYTAVFLTSPFNILETLSPIYPSFEVGLSENFVFVVLFVLLAESYSRYSMTRAKGLISVDVAFILSIVSTYTTSALWWWRTGVPASGTSIVAFDMLLFLAAVSMADFREYVNRGEKRGAEALETLLWVLAVGTSLVVAPTYVLGNPHFELHLVGMAVFACVSGLIVLLYHSPRKRLEEAGNTKRDIGTISVGSSSIHS